MNLHVSVACRRYYAIDAVVTSEGIEYKTYPAYDIERLKKYWAAQAVDPNMAVFLNRSDPFQPMLVPVTPDMTPLWTTDTTAVYDHPTQSDTYPSGVIKFKEDIIDNVDFSDHAKYDIFNPGAVCVTVPYSHDATLDLMVKPQTPPDRAMLSGVARGHQIPIHNSIAQTSHSKMAPHVAQRLDGNGAMISINVPLADMPPSKWDIVFVVCEAGLLRLNSESPLKPISAVPGNYIQNVMPAVYFKQDTATADVDGVVDLEFYLGTAGKTPITDHDATVYVKTTGGFLNKTKIRTVDGKGKVKLITTHLESGDVIKVSAGFQYYSGTDDCVVTVK